MPARLTKNSDSYIIMLAFYERKNATWHVRWRSLTENSFEVRYWFCIALLSHAVWKWVFTKTLEKRSFSYHSNSTDCSTACSRLCLGCGLQASHQGPVMQKVPPWHDVTMGSQGVSPSIDITWKCSFFIDMNYGIKDTFWKYVLQNCVLFELQYSWPACDFESQSQ